MSKLKKVLRTIQTKSVIINLGGKDYKMRLLTLSLFALAVVLLLIAILILIIVNSCSPSEPAEPVDPAAVVEPMATAGTEEPEDPDMPGDDIELDIEPEASAEPAATSEPEATLEPTKAPSSSEPVFTETVKLNYTGPIVKVIQQRLVDLYYMEYPVRTNGVGSVTEKFGSTSQRALKIFQQRNGLLETGECDEATYNKLVSSAANSYIMQKDDEWTMVKVIQTALKEQGYLDKVTGYCGNDTIEAIRNFQKNKGLAADGVAGKGTLSVLFGY